MITHDELEGIWKKSQDKSRVAERKETKVLTGYLVSSLIFNSGEFLYRRVRNNRSKIACQLKNGYSCQHYDNKHTSIKRTKH
jgi:hypothetical protein